MSDFGAVHSLATCRKCGAQGQESPDDPAPGICPECLERGMNEVTEWFCARITDEGVPMRQAYAEARERLVEQAGLAPEVAAHFLAAAFAEAGII